jgi:hypothetical protein
MDAFIMNRKLRTYFILSAMMALTACTSQRPVAGPVVRDDSLGVELRQVVSNYVQACHSGDLAGFRACVTQQALADRTAELAERDLPLDAEHLELIRNMRFLGRYLALPVIRVDTDGEHARLSMMNTYKPRASRPDLTSTAVYWFFKRERDGWKFVSDGGMGGSITHTELSQRDEAEFAMMFQIKRGRFRFTTYDLGICAAITTNDVEALLALVQPRSANKIGGISRAEHPNDIRVPVGVGKAAGYKIQVGNPSGPDYLVEVSTVADSGPNSNYGEVFTCMKTNGLWKIDYQAEWME